MPTWYNSAAEAYEDLGGNHTTLVEVDGRFAAVKDVSGIDRMLHTPHHSRAVEERGGKIITRPRPGRRPK